MLKNENKIKRLICYLLILIITTISLFFIFRDNIVLKEGQDLTFHLNRFLGIANCFEEGQIPPKIYPYANYGYGYATPLFYCDLFLYPFGILYHFGVSAVVCYKLCLFIYTLLGNVFVYYIFNKETNNKKLSLIAVVLYACSNYHLQNIYIRVALGEILAMTFIPLVLYAIYKILVKNEDSWILLGVSFSCLVMCHLISSFLYGIFFFVMIVIFIIINRKDIKLIKETLITIIKGTLLAILLCAWYLLPMFEQMHSQTFWLNVNAEQYNDINSGVQSIKEILTNIFAITDWNSFKIQSNASVGVLLFILSFVIFVVKKNKYINIIGIYSLVLYLIILGFIPGDFLNIIQFYFRLYIVIFPLLVVVATYVLANISNEKIKFTICSIVCIFSIINVFVCLRETNKGKYYLKNDANIYEINSINCYLYNLDYNHDELGGAEYLPYTERVNYEKDNYIKYKDEYGTFVKYHPDYRSSNEKKDFSTYEFTVECDNGETEVLLPVSYYKGYSAYIYKDNNWDSVDISYDEETKRLTVPVKTGINVYKVTYTGTPVQNVTLGISCITFVVLFIMCIKSKIWRKI